MPQNFWIGALPWLTHFREEEEGDGVLQSTNKLDVWVTSSVVLSSQPLPTTPLHMRSSSLRHHFLHLGEDGCICHSFGNSKENTLPASVDSIFL